MLTSTLFVTYRNSVIFCYFSVWLLKRCLSYLIHKRFLLFLITEITKAMDIYLYIFKNPKEQLLHSLWCVRIFVKTPRTDNILRTGSLSSWIRERGERVPQEYIQRQRREFISFQQPNGIIIGCCLLTWNVRGKQDNFGINEQHLKITKD